MAAHDFDVIVVGARCAGAPAAMLLARKGYRVLLVDRATFPSDTRSTHVLHPHGALRLARWGLLDRVVSTNCPPELIRLFEAMQGDQAAMDQFCRLNAGIESPETFFAPSNVERIFAAAEARAAQATR